MPLYQEIYAKRNRAYWEALDQEVHTYAQRNGLEYLRDDDSMNKPFAEPPTIVNYFYHEEVKKSAKQKRLTQEKVPQRMRRLVR